MDHHAAFDGIHPVQPDTVPVGPTVALGVKEVVVLGEPSTDCVCSDIDTVLRALLSDVVDEKVPLDVGSCPFVADHCPSGESDGAALGEA